MHRAGTTANVDEKLDTEFISPKHIRSNSTPSLVRTQFCFPSGVHTLYCHLQIDVMVLFSPQAATAAGGELQLLADISVGFPTANVATSNSGIDADFNLVHVAEVRPELGQRGL